MQGFSLHLTITKIPRAEGGGYSYAYSARGTEFLGGYVPGAKTAAQARKSASESLREYLARDASALLVGGVR